MSRRHEGNMYRKCVFHNLSMSAINLLLFRDNFHVSIFPLLQFTACCSQTHLVFWAHGVRSQRSLSMSLPAREFFPIFCSFGCSSSPARSIIAALTRFFCSYCSLSKTYFWISNNGRHSDGRKAFLPCAVFSSFYSYHPACLRILRLSAAVWGRRGALVTAFLLLLLWWQVSARMYCFQMCHFPACDFPFGFLLLSNWSWSIVRGLRSRSN